MLDDLTMFVLLNVNTLFQKYDYVRVIRVRTAEVVLLAAVVTCVDVRLDSRGVTVKQVFLLSLYSNFSFNLLSYQEPPKRPLM